jgi:hypothetical protein
VAYFKESSADLFYFYGYLDNMSLDDQMTGE